MNEDTMPAQDSPKSNNLLAVIGIIIVFGIIGYVVMQNNVNQGSVVEEAVVEETREDGEAMEKELPNVFNRLDLRNGMFM